MVALVLHKLYTYNKDSVEKHGIYYKISQDIAKYFKDNKENLIIPLNKKKLFKIFPLIQSLKNILTSNEENELVEDKKKSL